MSEVPGGAWRRGTWRAPPPARSPSGAGAPACSCRHSPAHGLQPARALCSLAREHSARDHVVSFYNMAHTRQSRPESGLDFQVEVHKCPLLDRKRHLGGHGNVEGGAPPLREYLRQPCPCHLTEIQRERERERESTRERQREADRERERRSERERKGGAPRLKTDDASGSTAAGPAIRLAT